MKNLGFKIMSVVAFMIIATGLGVLIYAIACEFIHGFKF